MILCFTFRNSLFGAVKMIKNADCDTHSYSWYGNSFVLCGIFSSSNDGFGKMVVIFGADLGSYVLIDN